MIFDRSLLLSNAQAITATARSTDVIDLLGMGTVYKAAAALPRDLGKGNQIPFLVQIVETFNNLTSLRIDIDVDDNSAFSSAKTVASQTILLADLKAGKQIAFADLPNGIDERYLSVNYTVTGAAPSTGKVTAGVVMGVQTSPN
jgi:hypothetical protein